MLFSLILICAFGLTCAGCAGNDPDSMTVPLYGTKVLYRPDHYDYDQNSGNAGYYGQYAWNILNILTSVYGTSTYTNTSTPHNELKDYISSQTKKEYLYDSIRYQIVEQTNDGDNVKYVANTAYSWIWTFNYDISPVAFIDSNYTIDAVEQSGNLLTNYFAKDGDTDNYIINISDYYTNNQTTYINTYVGTYNPQTDADKTSEEKDELYSEYVKALEYVIYCMSMEIEPRTITPNPATGNVTIDTFASVDAALEYVRDLFARRGNMVGITPGKQKRISNYILQNVIGEAALNNDIVRVNGTSVTVGRNYETVVENVVKNVCEEVSIGSEKDADGNDSSIHLDNTFVSSAIRDYYLNYFFISTEPHAEFAHIPQLEYQSAVLMFSDDVAIANMMLHFKYDAGMNGDELVDPNASLTVRVYLNHYSHDTNTYQTLADSTITIPDGPFNFGERTHTLSWFGLNPKPGEGLRINKWNPDIGDGVMRAQATDNEDGGVSSEKYLSGITGVIQDAAYDVRLKDYYKLVSSDSETLESTYYSYGILNEKMFAGEDGCDFLEIAFEVVKATGENDNNYKFQVGLGLIA